VGGVQQVLGMLAAEGFTLPFPVDDVPLRLGDITVIEREGKVRKGWGGVGWGGRLQPSSTSHAGMLSPRTVLFLLLSCPRVPTKHCCLPPCAFASMQVLGVAAINDVGCTADDVRVAELGAFVVHPAYRRAGFGDSLLDYVEQVSG